MKPKLLIKNIILKEIVKLFKLEKKHQYVYETLFVLPNFISYSRKK